MKVQRVSILWETFTEDPEGGETLTEEALETYTHRVSRPGSTTERSL